MKKIAYKAIFACQMDPKRNDIAATTVREFLVRTLATMVRQGESFSGKRPFGNSDWDWQLYQPLVQAGMIEGKVDDYGVMCEVDEEKAAEIIASALEESLKES